MVTRPRRRACAEGEFWMSVLVPFEPGMRTLGPAVVAIGVFDGVHLGHQKLLATAALDANRRGGRAIGITFDRDPDQIIDPPTAAPQLLSLDDKIRFMGETGIEAVLVVPFTEDVAAMPPAEFLDKVLASAVDPLAIHVGHDFRFGARAAGDVDDLQRWAAVHDVDIAPHQLLEIDGEPVTSTRIRRLVAAGDVAEARRLLGRPTRVTGTVVRGRGAGRQLGIPTANIAPARYSALPGDGVYAGLAEVGETTFPAAISVGTPPMFPEARDYLEAHLVGFDGDLYDRQLTLRFVEHLRDQCRYDSVDDLVSAIHEDIRHAVGVLGVDAATGRV